MAPNKSSTPWRWGETKSAAQDKLKRAVIDGPVLMHPDSDKPFFVVTYASKPAASASLEQEIASAQRRPITVIFNSLCWS